LGAISIPDAAARVGALAGRASVTDFAKMAHRLADASRGTPDEYIYRSLAGVVTAADFTDDDDDVDATAEADITKQKQQLWYATPAGFDIARRMVHRCVSGKQTIQKKQTIH
jgi:hypothetical protein